METVTDFNMTFGPHSETTKCIEIGTFQDDVVEEDEYFTVILSVLTVLPGSLQSNLIRGTLSSTVTVRDTSKSLAIIIP